VIHNFFEPQPSRRTREEVRRELGVDGEVVLLHASNLRPLKRIDLLLATAARLRPREAFKLVILAAAISPRLPARSAGWGWRTA